MIHKLRLCPLDVSFLNDSDTRRLHFTYMVCVSSQVCQW